MVLIAQNPRSFSVSVVNRGASIEATTAQPSIDLASLLQCLAEAITPLAAGKPEHSLPLLELDTHTQTLRVLTLGVLARLLAGGGRSRLTPGRGRGFFRAVSAPRGPARGWLGGRLVSGSDRALADRLGQLVAAIDADIDRVCAAHRLQLSDFQLDRVHEHLAASAKRVGLRHDLLSGQTRLVPMRIAPSAATASARKHDIARLISAVETVHGSQAGRGEQFIQAVCRRLAQRDDADADEREVVADSLREQLVTPGSQLNRFLGFLEQDALSRLRLRISGHLMAAIADDVHARAPSAAPAQCLVAYVARTQALIDGMLHVDAPDIDVKLARDFPHGDFLLNDELAKVGLYACLPVWCEWVAQIFEHSTSDGEGERLAREVSYRFRINGLNPAQNLPAFTARLQRLRRDLFPDEGEPHAVPRSLAELAVLLIATGDDALDNGRSLDDAIPERLANIVAYLNRRGKPAVADALDVLEQRTDRVEQIARGLVHALQRPGPRLSERVSGKRWTYFLNVGAELVDWSRLVTALDQPLNADPSGHREAIDFFRAVSISDERPGLAQLFSVKLSVHLAEHSLVAAGPPVTLALRREVPPRAVQVLWRPYRYDKNTPAPLVPEACDLSPWRWPRAIEIEYTPKYLEPLKHHRDETAFTMLAATRSAFAILTYLTLLRLLRQMAPAGIDGPPPTLLMLRLQRHGRTSADDAVPGHKATEAVYAASQAVEQALARDYPTRLQGLVDAGDAKDAGIVYRRRAALAALCGGLPIQLTTPQTPRLARVGVITFATRPCAVQPEQPNPARERHVVLARAYRLERLDPTAGFRICIDRGRTDIGEGDGVLAQPDLIQEEIRRLHATGCNHILYITHRYQQRRLGRADPRNRTHDSAVFLNRLNEAFPNLVLYPLVRDVFPATRLRRKAADEDAFEITGVNAHRGQTAAERLRARYTPVYTLATLMVIGRDPDQRPQSGFASYFLLNDQHATDQERAQRVRSQLMLPESEVRADLLAALRSVHYLEAEKAPANGFIAPVLDPFAWRQPETVGGAGDIVVLPPSRRRAGAVLLSLQALLTHVSDALHGRHHAG